MSEDKFNYEEYVQNKFDEAIELTANSQYKEAIDILMQIVEKSEEKVPIYSSLANNYICLSDYDNACQMYDNAINYAKDDYIKDNIIMQKANLLFEIGKYAEAIEHYTQVENDNSYSYEVYANKAKCYYELKDYKQSLLYANKYLNEISNDNKDMLTICGTCFYELRQYQDALKIYLKLYVLNKNNVEILKSIVSCYVNIKDYNSAIQYNKELIEYIIKQLNAKKKMLEHSILKSDTESIHMYQEKIYNLEQELSTEYYKLAELYDKMDNRSNAKKYYDLSLEYKPQKTIVFDENFDEKEYAQSMYEQALELMPEDIGVGDKEYLAITIKQFFQMSAEAMLKDYPEFSIDTILFAAQVIAEWTFHKGVDIIRAGIPEEYRDGLLQKVAFIAYETLTENIRKGTPQETLIERVEKKIKKGFYESINELCLRKCITEDIVQKLSDLSNDDSLISRIKEQDINQDGNEQYESDDEVFDFMREDLEKQYSNNDESFQNIKEEEEYYKSEYEELTKMIEDEPNNSTGYYFRADLQKKQNPQKALEDINKAIELNPKHIDSYAIRALIYRELANHVNPDECSSYDEYYEKYSKFYELEIEDLTKILDSAVNKEEVAYERGLAKNILFDEQGAQDDFKLSIEINPNFIAPYYELSKIEIKRENYSNAIEYLDKAVEKIPDAAELYLLRGEAKEKGGNYEGAKADYKKALEINPDCEYIENALNGINIINQYDEEFNTQYKKITQYIIENPNDAEAYYNRGYLQSCHEVEDEIILSDFDKAIELNPNYAEAYQQRIYIFEHMGKYEQLKKDYEKLIELEPTFENYDMYTRYLNTYFENGSKMALEVCNKMFEIFPASDSLYQLRGAAYYHLKDYDNAISDYKKAVELNPKNDTWKRLLKKIEQEKNNSE